MQFLLHIQQAANLYHPLNPNRTPAPQFLNTFFLAGSFRLRLEMVVSNELTELIVDPSFIAMVFPCFCAHYFPVSRFSRLLNVNTLKVGLRDTDDDKQNIVDPATRHRIRGTLIVGGAHENRDSGIVKAPVIKLSELCRR
jgi:hypothetical protein